MERIPFEPGRVVLSRQGRDEGRYFIVLQVLDDAYILIADGKSRSMHHPKKKKMKHVFAKPYLMNLEQRFPSRKRTKPQARTPRMWQSWHNMAHLPDRHILHHKQANCKRLSLLAAVPPIALLRPNRLPHDSRIVNRPA